MRTPKAWLVERGHRMAWQRHAYGLTQEEVATRLKVRRPAVSEIEAGRRDLSLAEACELAHLLGVGVEWLTGDGSQLTNWRDRPNGAA